jgi:hypothetical protein
MMPLRIPNAIFSLLFAYATIVQYNDPDPIPWILIYLAATAVCATSVLRRIPWRIPLAVGVVAALWMATLIPEVFGGDGFTGNEIQRESGGLLVVWTWMILLALRTRRA